jgi:hypothetical protein
MFGKLRRAGLVIWVPLTAWGFCLMWAFSIGYFSRYSPIFMIFERGDYDKRRLHEFEQRFGAVDDEMSKLLASQWRFNDASEIPCTPISFPHYMIATL